MRELRFDPTGNAPIVPVVIDSPRGRRKLELILDTGAERTQIHVRTMLRLGFTEAMKTRSARAVGVGGGTEQGYLVRLTRFAFLGSVAEDFEVAVFDMSYLERERIDGLIGWDLVRLMHLEMDGPKGLLKVF